MRIILAISFSLMVLAVSHATAPASSLRIAVAGDVMMGTNYPDNLPNAYLPDNNGAHLFKHVTPILRSADAAAANLEGTLLDSGGKVKECKDTTLLYAFRTPIAYVSNLKQAGFDFMSLANNHINDFGQIGRESTKATLEKAGIGYAGLNTDKPWHIMNIRGRIVGFTAFSPHARSLSIHDTAALQKIVTHMDSICDIVVVSFHGGGEGAAYQHVPEGMEECFGEKRGDVRKFAHAAIDAGADIVYGHGPHVTRAMELYSDRLILYSLGNFCTPYRVNLKGIAGHAPIVTIDVDSSGKFLNGKIHPFVQRRGIGPVPDTKGYVIRQMRSLTKSDFPTTPLNISPDGTITRTK